MVSKVATELLNRRRTLAAALAFAALAVTVPYAADQSLTLAVKGRVNANVTLAVQGTFVVAAWSASDAAGATDLYAAVSRDAGATFTAPARVNSTPGEVRVNGEQPPRVGLVPRDGNVPAIVVVWTAKGAKGTVLLNARSNDGGRTFSRSSLVPGTDAPGNRGWESITVDGTGSVAVLWLDHRQLEGKSGDAASMHHHTGAAPTSSAPANTATPPRDGVAMAQLSKLYFGRLTEGSTREITGGVCYCCKTAVLAQGTKIYSAWRHVYDGNMRDIAFTASRDGGRTFSPPVRISRDGWQLEGCPDDGPSMAIERNGVAHVVWPTLLKTEKGEQTIGLFHALTRDGATFTPRTRIETSGVAHHPQVAVNDQGMLAVTWDELLGARRQVVLARGSVDAKGQLRLQRTVISGTESGVYPVVAFAGDAVISAWSGGTAPAVIRLVRSPAR